MDKNPRGGSIPLVAFDTTELLSDGICADSVECLRPCSKMDALSDSQSYCSAMEEISSTSFLYVSMGRIPSAYLVRPKYSQ